MSLLSQGTRALKGFGRIPRLLTASKTAGLGLSYCQHRGLHSLHQHQQRALNSPTQTEPKPTDFVTVSPWGPIHPAYLRDCCTCDKCVDPSSKQKNFQTTDIPKNLTTKSLDISPDTGAVTIAWENDIPGFEQDHKSIFPQAFFHVHSTAQTLQENRYPPDQPKLWNRETISRELEYVSYDEYMNTEAGLYRALLQLSRYGLLLVRGVPESENSVEDIALRIGNIRDTLYKRTWDVKSVPQAKNVAFTPQFLGLHMDLLYMTNPPGFQFLHCIQNSCEGGSSLFSDSFWSVSKLSTDNFFHLASTDLAYHYKNAGEHYYFRHPLINLPEMAVEPGQRHRVTPKFVNYSPPFQADHISVGDEHQKNFPPLLEALREFTSLVESESNLFEFRLQEGECVIFNNRRVLHGRRQFDTATGARWLKGAYLDTDVFMSKYRVLSERFLGQDLTFKPQLVNPELEPANISQAVE